MSSIDLKQLLSSDKFLPIHVERKNLAPLALGPVAVELHWTSACNYNCVHCSYGSRRRSRGTLAPETIQGIIDDLIALKTQAVYLSGGGEPTMVAGWDGYASQFLNHGVDVALVTNSIAVQERHLEILRRMNYIAVSVYSVDLQEYRKITGGDYYEKQFKLPSLIKQGEHRCIIGARCVLNSINHRNLVNIYRHAMDSGFDYIIFIPAVDYEQSGVSLTSDEIAAIGDIITKHESSFDLSRTNVDSLVKRGVHHYESADYRTSFASPPGSCTTISIRGNAFINYDGSVYLCQPLIGESDYSIGDLSKARFRDIWNSLRHIEVIKKLDERFSRGECRVCRSIGFNKAVEAFTQHPKNLTKIPKDPFI